MYNFSIKDNILTHKDWLARPFKFSSEPIFGAHLRHYLICEMPLENQVTIAHKKLYTCTQFILSKFPPLSWKSTPCSASAQSDTNSQLHFSHSLLSTDSSFHLSIFFTSHLFIYPSLYSIMLWMSSPSLTTSLSLILTNTLSVLTSLLYFLQLWEQ